MHGPLNRWRNALRLLVATGLVLCASHVTPALAQDFYEQQLVAGKIAYQASRMVQANDELRIAAFGLLDRPVLLSEALVRLSLAQNALGLTTELTRTFDRFIVLEQRFQPYAKLQLEAPVRTTFEALLIKSVPPATLSAIPSLSRLIETEDQKIGKMSRADRIRALENAARREPKDAHWPLWLAREYVSADDMRNAVRWGGRALEIDSSNTEARALLAHARAARGECSEALTLISQLPPAELDRRSDLYADEAVCYADRKQWKEAQTTLAKVPETLRGRADVKRAAQDVAQALPPPPLPKTSEKFSSAASKGTRTGSAGSPNTREPVATATSSATGAIPSTASRPPASGPAPTQSNPTTPATDHPTTFDAARASHSAEVLEQSRILVRAARYRDAFKLLGSAVGLDPANRPLRLAFLEAAVLTGDYRAGASQAELVSPLSTGEELYMFYAAVALYETGNKEDARRLMEKARPKMVPGPFVDYYIRTILGSAA